MGISARRGRGRERWSSECRGIPLMWWMRWTRLYAAVAIACVFGVSAMSEDGPDAHFSADELMLGDSAAPEHDPVKTALQKKMQAVGELHEEAKDLLGERSVERQRKAQAAVEFMENYNGKKAMIEKKQATLRAEMADDKATILRTSKGDEKENELTKKHDARIKATMKRALNAMRKVDHVVNGHQRRDPTVKAAEKAVIEARGKEIYTVLGLDEKQLNQDYLLTLDGAVAAYNSMPDAHSEEKMEKALEVTKERVKKEKIIEMKKKKEVKAKKTRSTQNQMYYKTKWKEKRAPPKEDSSRQVCS